MTISYDDCGYAVWLAAKKVVEKLLRELHCGESDEHRDRISSALFARLAAHEPPILPVWAEEVNYRPALEAMFRWQAGIQELMPDDVRELVEQAIPEKRRNELTAQQGE